MLGKSADVLKGTADALTLPLKGTARQIQVVGLARRIDKAYRRLQKEVEGLPNDEQAQRFEELHRECAAQVVELASRLGGFFAKMAQPFAMHEDLPEAYRSALS
eukprot:6467378-Prymnesium_polylepis.1